MDGVSVAGDRNGDGGVRTELSGEFTYAVHQARVRRGSTHWTEQHNQIEHRLPRDLHGSELTISATDGSTTLSPVAVALNGCGVTVKELTLRTPTLDDVFLALTGAHIEAGTNADAAGDETEEAR